MGGPATPFLAGVGTIAGLIVLFPARFGLLGWNLLRMREWARIVTVGSGCAWEGWRGTWMAVGSASLAVVLHDGDDDSPEHQLGDSLVSESGAHQTTV